MSRSVRSPNCRLILLATVLLPVALASTTGAIAAEPPLVLFLGDSLSAGYGLGEELAFPHLVGEALGEMGLPVRVINAGVSGDTTAGGLARVDWALRLEPDVVVVELGGNDGLRGLEVEMTDRNLRQIVDRCRRSGAEVLLLGMRMPPNYGEYAQRFENAFRSIAEDLDLAWIPFLLEGVGGRADLNLADGMHPNEEGHRILADNVTPVLAELIRALD